MVSRPSLANFFSYPITAGLALGAIGVSLMFFSGANVGPLVLAPIAFYQEPWRLVTWILPHGGALHLLFNVYWLWVFGAYIENNFGHAKTALLVVACAVASGAGQYFVSGGNPIGLSGVTYGLFGFCWAASRVNPRYSDAMDAQTRQILVAWFFIAIALTQFRMMNIANVAHGLGAGMGYLAGMTLAIRSQKRLLGIAGAVLLFMLCLYFGPRGPLGIPL